MTRKTIGYLILIVAILFGFAETQHFGYNFIPKSSSEEICDAVVVVLSIISAILIYKKK